MDVGRKQMTSMSLLLARKSIKFVNIDFLSGLEVVVLTTKGCVRLLPLKVPSSLTATYSENCPSTHSGEPLQPYLFYVFLSSWCYLIGTGKRTLDPKTLAHWQVSGQLNSSWGSTEIVGWEGGNSRKPTKILLLRDLELFCCPFS